MSRKPVDNLDLMVRRKRLGLSQNDAAQALGVAQEAISRWEKYNATSRTITREKYDAWLKSHEAQGVA